MVGVSGMEGRYDSEGDEEEQIRGWGSVGSNSNELMEEYEAYGGGAGGSDEEGLVEEWSGRLVVAVMMMVVMEGLQPGRAAAVMGCRMRW